MATENVLQIEPEDGVNFWAHELREALEQAEQLSEEPSIFVHLEDGRGITSFRVVVDRSDGETSIYLTIG